MLELDGVALDDRSGIPLTDDQMIHRVWAVLGGDGEPPSAMAP
ncbi:MAG: hypothetical protein ABI647_16990 [Gemmatimonadota bacterium]